MGPRAGEHQAVKITAFFQVPWEMPEERVDFDHYVRKFIERKEREGWRFHRVLDVWRERFPFVRDTQLVREYTIEAVFSRAAKPLLLRDAPAHLVNELMRKYPGRFKYA